MASWMVSGWVSDVCDGSLGGGDAGTECAGICGLGLGEGCRLFYAGSDEGLGQFWCEQI